VDFAEQQRKPGKHLVALSVVAVLHILLGYALVNGLATKVVEVIKGPIETKIIEEVKPPPPPPENLPPPPKFQPPPPSFVPPPEVVVNPPPQMAPTITTTQEPPPVVAPVRIAPVAPEAPPVTSARAAVPTIVDASRCAPGPDDYPAAAVRSEATGTTLIRFTIDATGKVAGSQILKSAGSSREHKMLDRVAVEKFSTCKFTPGTDATGKAVGATKDVEYVWKLN
jgi:protein TonB